MANGISVDVVRSGFPVSIGPVELWFDTSDEFLVTFFDLEQEAKKRLAEFEKSIVEANLDKKLEEGITKDTLLGAIDLEKKLLEIQYDLLFGDGTFEKLYAEFPDHQALDLTLEKVAALIEAKLSELKIERENIVKERINKYKKKSKTAKK
ncbi:TPA: hypothetical protein U2D46_001829 [Streptococcus suis]|uniref:hypothetical protein n=3 Tax=Streptococcus suis TaxID=1307 RepID=UPI0003F75B09|nr:hypothetical protein [Streptococcus suis]NQL53914.1 hypothetical protein [Streptococcus suis]NQM23037.1 hypothetical protein [Streptococcus suis]HEL1630260.1 hypothetical protein [Streptococcus suis]HEM4066034.1 hypothetical protein [Streptococcus suis]HEM4273521.1 hypothetical protein [Streptococcus suis]